MKDAEWFPKEQWGDDFTTYCDGNDKHVPPSRETWADALESLLESEANEVVKDESKENRIDSSVLVVCIDHLNGSGQKDYSLYKFIEDDVKMSNATRLLDLLARCDKSIYVRTAKAARWGMPSDVDDISKAIRDAARGMGIVTLESDWFWSTLGSFAQKGGRYVPPRVFG